MGRGKKSKPDPNYSDIKLGINVEFFFSNLFLLLLNEEMVGPSDNDYFIIIREILNILLLVLTDLGDFLLIH